MTKQLGQSGFKMCPFDCVSLLLTESRNIGGEKLALSTN